MASLALSDKVTRITQGVYLVQTPMQFPTTVGVFLYANLLWRCERHDYGSCEHVQAVVAAEAAREAT